MLSKGNRENPTVCVKAPVVLEGFHSPVQAWFSASFEKPTQPQELGWPVIRSGQSTLILAPTGSGKTLAAFLAAIDRLMFEPVPVKEKRCRVLYISPLKALAVDVERNLRAPLVGVSRYAERMNVEVHEPSVAIRTGDTPSSERAQFQRHPTDILITTPESLYLLLTSNAREALKSVEVVIVDEIHAMVATKRGAHLALSLERLEALVTKPLQRIGLSATQRPLDEVARFLGGNDVKEDRLTESWSNGVSESWKPSLPDSADTFERWIGLNDPETSELLDNDSGNSRPHHSTTPPLHHSSPRPIHIIDAGSRKELDLRVEVPVEDMARLRTPIEIPSGNAAQGDVLHSIWPAIHPMVLDLVKQHRTTLIFVNSRRLAERMASALNELAGDTVCHAHHGSVAREQRLLIEDQLKSGKLPALVATSSLELGIDMGSIDLVIQVESPPSVASGMQRIGRAGHHIGVPSKGIIVPKFRGDLLSCAALTERMKEGAVEEMRYLRNPLDILAQQIVAMVSMDDWKVDELESVIRRAAPFNELPRRLLEETLDMLSGRYPSDEFAELRPRITWDRINGMLYSREGAKRVAITNGGTIPDRGLYGVFLVGAEEGQGRVGELDEEMVLESHPGDVFLLGASSWRIEEITYDRVLVTPAPGEPGKMPFWHGEHAGRPLEFGKAIGRLSREIREQSESDAMARLQTRHDLDELAARNLLAYLRDQAEATGGAVPDDRTVVVESYMDELGDWRVCVLSPFGSKVHAPWAMAIGAMVRERTDFDIDVLWTDDGIVIRFPEADEPPPIEAVIPDPDEVEDLVIRQLGSGASARHIGTSAVPNALFASRFRESAARALLLPRRHPGQRAALWQQRKRAADLLHATSQYGSFPIILETYRECLKDVFDMPALIGLLREIRSRQIRVVPVTTRIPSPFAASLMFNYVANFMYEGDSPMAERRAQALTVDPIQLRALLGQVELRELLDPEAIEILEQQLQHLTPERQARHPDGLHDLLLRLGDLTRDEIHARCVNVSQTPNSNPSSIIAEINPPAFEAASIQADEWIRLLASQRRIISLPIASEMRYIAAEEAGRYRDALGIPPPPGLPDAFLEFARDPIGDLVARYARTHGPFHVEVLASRYGLGIAPVLNALEKLQTSGRTVEGEFRPGGSGREWCDSGVLRAIRQKSLARLRHEVEPVDHAALGRLYLSWQNVRTLTQTHDDGRWTMDDTDKSSTNRIVHRPSSIVRKPSVLLHVIEKLQGASIPASDLESRILPARIAGYDPRELDSLISSGQVLWVGREPLGQNDGRISLYLAEHAPLFLDVGVQATDDTAESDFDRRSKTALGRTVDANDHASGATHEAIRSCLATRGASFFQQIQHAVGGFTPDLQEALWDLVWSGKITNDTFQPLRAFLNPSRGRTAKRQRDSSSRRHSYNVPRRSVSTSSIAVDTGTSWRREATIQSVSPEASGRWSLVNGLVFGEPTPAERLSGRTNQLLDRYGVLTREAVQSEGIEGGFSSIYGILKAMEETGRVRRGYFVTGLGATQFALPGVVDRLRSLREPNDDIESVVLAATDPANPYGAALSWPEPPGANTQGEPSSAEVGATDPVARNMTGRHPMRMAGAIVILVDGALVAWMGRGERRLLTFLDKVSELNREDVADAIARSLAAEVVPGRRRALYITEVDGRPTHESHMADALARAGFVRTANGYLRRTQ